jgi:hypothetical protein
MRLSAKCIFGTSRLPFARAANFINRLQKHSHSFSTVLEHHPHIWWCLLLTPQVPRRTIPSRFCSSRDFPVECGLRQPSYFAAGGKYRCSICLVSRFSASTRCVTCAAIGCAPTLQDPSPTTAVAPVAATCCAPSRRLSALVFACDLVPSRPARRCAPVRASGGSPQTRGAAAEKHAAPFLFPMIGRVPFWEGLGYTPPVQGRRVNKFFGL